jgi:O-antigen/teichoic acid export membrane protein
VLFASPLLFDVALAGKYDGGRAVMPMTLAYCTWNGLFVVAQMYLWCAEKTRWTCVPLLIALAANVGLNVLLMPLYGLAGAVLATTIANAAALAITFRVNTRIGMQVDAGTWIMCCLPACLCGGTGTAAAGLTVVCIAVLTSKALFSASERARFATIASERLGPLARWFGSTGSLTTR